MNRKERREVITRAFVATGLDDVPGMIRYIDQLERTLLRLDRDIHDRQRTRPRANVLDIVQEVLR